MKIKKQNKIEITELNHLTLNFLLNGLSRHFLFQNKKDFALVNKFLNDNQTEIQNKILKTLDTAMTDWLEARYHTIADKHGDLL